MAVKKLVFIDDDPVYLFTVHKLLEILNYKGDVNTFDNGQSAFNGIKNLMETGNELDVVFLDVNMPIWDGWDFLEELIKSKLDFSFKIYLISSSDSEIDLKRSKKYTILSDFLTKPLKKEILEQIIG